MPFYMAQPSIAPPTSRRTTATQAHTESRKADALTKTGALMTGSNITEDPFQLHRRPDMAPPSLAPTRKASAESAPAGAVSDPQSDPSG